MLLPIGIKTKIYYEKINITAQLQTNIEKELADFYKKNIPLNNYSFDEKSLKYKEKNHEKEKNRKTKKAKIKIHEP
jgi:hypothetical protein